MWKLASKPTTRPATKSLASQFANMLAAPGDRNMSERRLAAYERAYRAGQFRPVTWATCHCKETNETYRVNGKHTSILLSGLDEIHDFYVTIEHYEADSLDDVARLYSTFDSRMQNRTTGDINQSFAATIPELASLSARLINLAVTGISFGKHYDHYSSVSPADRAEYLVDNIEFVLWVNGLLSGGSCRTSSCKHLGRGPVVGAMYSTFQRCRRDSTTFWQAVRDETGPRPGDPDRRIAKYLITTSVSMGNGATASTSNKAAPREFYAKCIHAWNAWRKNTTTDLRYFPDKKLPAAA